MIRYRLVDSDEAMNDLREGFARCKLKAETEGDADFVADQIRKQKALWLVMDDANVVVSIDNDALFIWLCWGRNFREWYATMRHDLTELARYYGLKKFRMGSPRKAWRVLLPNAREVNGFFEEEIHGSAS